MKRQAIIGCGGLTFLFLGTWIGSIILMKINDVGPKVAQAFQSLVH